MANPGLLTALGSLGAGLSTYGRVQKEREALNRALEERDYERARLGRMESIAAADRQRAIDLQNQATERQKNRDILDAILGGLRPAGAAGLSIGGQQFQLPEVLTENERINQRKSLFKTAFPQLNDAQADLLARGALRPGEVIVDPGTVPPPRRTPTFGNPPANSPRTMFSQLFGAGLNTTGGGLPR